jgi:hypothetical protein
MKRSGFRVALAFALLVSAIACEKVPLLAPTESTIAVAADTLTLAPGGRTQITATVMEQGGTAVQNGTLVRFSATLGRVEPAEVETRGGVAVSTFIAGTASGTAQVRAASGAASGGGGGENGAAATNVVEIRIGGAAASSIVVSANPSRLGAAGGSTTITGALLDGVGNRLSNVPITFSTTAGTLSASSALTDANGEARVTLTTRSAAKVTARAGGAGDSAISAEVDVTVSAAGTVSLAIPTTTPVAGAPVQLTVTPAENTAPDVLVFWGDDSSNDLGTVTAARTVTHVYQAAGTYTITAISGDEDAAFRTSITVTVAPRPPVSVNLTADPTTATRCTPIRFTATLPPGDSNTFRSFRWTIDSNESSEDQTVTTSGNQLTRVFWQTGRKTVSVTAETTDGRSGDAQTQVVITETTPPSDGRDCR